LNGKVADIYFPDREIEGYGLNEDALNHLKKHSPALLVVLDCSIGNFAEVKLAKKLGFEVIIIEHHKTLNRLPVASIIVNPKQKGDRYPFKEFATAGIVFKLVEILMKRKLTLSLRNNFLELVALATIADTMPQTGDNLEFIQAGLRSLKNTFRPSFKVFWKIDPTIKDNIRQFSQRIISACHAGGGKNHLNEGYLLLISDSVKKAESAARYLLEKAYDRHLLIKEIVGEVEKKALKKLKEPIIFEGDKLWPVLMLGPVASKICHSYKKPVFLYSRKKGYCQGAVRTPAGIDGVQAMMHCAKNLETYGGHPQAAGFRVKDEDLEEFQNCLVKYFKSL
jgi:single-stranded-DNA-specific exonuclease